MWNISHFFRCRNNIYICYKKIYLFYIFLHFYFGKPCFRLLFFSGTKWQSFFDLPSAIVCNRRLKAQCPIGLRLTPMTSSCYRIDRAIDFTDLCSNGFASDIYFTRHISVSVRRVSLVVQTVCRVGQTCAFNFILLETRRTGLANASACYSPFHFKWQISVLKSVTEWQKLPVKKCSGKTELCFRISLQSKSNRNFYKEIFLSIASF